MTVTKEQLVKILPNSKNVADKYIGPINDAMAKYQINTPKRIAAFLAQVGHESAHLTAVVENLNYSSESLQRVWPSRFPKALADQVARKPEQIANIAYASRMGNGAPASGDGWAYKGRGLIQTTGKDNYRVCGEALGIDLIRNPELLEQPKYAALSAGWFWNSRKLNALADSDSFTKITQAVNGGQNGASDRVEIYQHALSVLA